jgi:uncharacterized membrane protein YGL010W
MTLREWLLEQLAMYAAYHRDWRNRATHHVGVPVIVFSLLLAFDRLVVVHDGSLRITAGQLLLGALMALYLASLPLVGVGACIFYAAVYAIVLRVPADLALPVAGAAFVGGWAIQFLGHVFEGRRPALFVNLTQVFMAPAFLIAEMLFSVGLEGPLSAELARRSARYAKP